MEQSESEMDFHFCLPFITATENAWRAGYTGEAAHLLLDHIKNFLPGTQHDNMHPDFKQLYAQYTAIIQASGMGKSHTIDEMAKHELVIPIVLRPANSTGRVSCSKSSESQTTFDHLFCRISDSVVRDFLISPGAFQRALTFLHALFNEVASVAKHTEAPLKGLAPLDRIKPFAQQFRAYMNHGMTMGGHGEFRTQFYEKVINNAYKVCITSIGYLTILTQVR